MENIQRITPFEVEVYKCRTRSIIGKKDLIGKATVVGAYFREYWHPYVHKAYHVIYEDGRKDTVLATHVKVKV
ncbi:hypothetical protein Goe21_00850 [Bacillus phage vB_BsuM-Goe21]|nr:hypothetical protein Goe21_00850 [Bacillus phage vB_BsuM-Goe21]